MILLLCIATIRYILFGTIKCCTNSYHVEVFSVEDIQLYGPFGLKLVPFNDTHRCWYFIAEDEESKKEWEEVGRKSAQIVMEGKDTMDNTSSY